MMTNLLMRLIRTNYYAYLIFDKHVWSVSHNIVIYSRNSNRLVPITDLESDRINRVIEVARVNIYSCRPSDLMV